MKNETLHHLRVQNTSDGVTSCKWVKNLKYKEETFTSTFRDLRLDSIGLILFDYIRGMESKIVYKHLQEPRFNPLESTLQL